MENDGKALGHFPDGWVQYNLERIATKITKGATPTTYGFTFLNDGIKFIKVENIRNNSIDIKGIKHFISEEAHGYQKRSILEENDILFSIAGTIGNTCIIKKEHLPANTNQALAIIGGYLDLVVPKLLKLQLASFITDSTKAKARGGAMNNISLGDLKNLEIIIPPLPEQNQIVAKIEELFSELDNGIENLKKARKQLKTYRQAVLKYAFEGKLTKGSVKAKNVKIKDLFTLIDGDRGRNYPKKDDYLQKGFCLFLSTKNVRFGKFEFYETVFISEIKHNELHSGTLKRGDIVITTRGTIGNVAFYDERIPYDVVRINSGMLILRTKSDKVYEKYFLHYIGSPTFWNQIQKKRSGTAQPQLPAGVLKEFDIPLFAKGIQRNIVQEIESRLSICDQLEQSIEDSLKKAEALRQSILKKAFAGKLTRDWREKHPELIAGENSAEKLLERIKAEKALSATGRKKPRSKKTKKK